MVGDVWKLYCKRIRRVVDCDVSVNHGPNTRWGKYDLRSAHQRSNSFDGILPIKPRGAPRRRAWSWALEKSFPATGDRTGLGATVRLKKVAVETDPSRTFLIGRHLH